jgi:protein-disulfide isomerase
VRIVWKHLPLDIHKDAPGAHLASVAAQQQGKFWEFHDKIFANPRDLKIDTYKRYAQELGLDMARFEKDMISLELQKLVDADKAEAASMEVTGTPGFFINGRFLRGAKPFEEFAKLINEELEKKGLPVPEEARS